MCRNKNIKFYTQHQEINWLKLNAKANHRAGLQSTMYSPSLFYCSRLKPNIQSKTQLIPPPPRESILHQVFTISRDAFPSTQPHSDDKTRNLIILCAFIPETPIL